MATKGTVNVVCHGTIAFVVDGDGGIELWMPEVNSAWDHRWQAGSWANSVLDELKPGEEYSLTGVKPGDGDRRFDPVTNIHAWPWRSPAPEPPNFDGKLCRRVTLPPPKEIYSVNTVSASLPDTFQNPGDKLVKDLRQIALLQVLSYDCDDLDAVRLSTAPDREPFNWVPPEGNGLTPPAVNLHIFAEPWTYAPAATRDSSSYKLPFNVLIDGFKGAGALAMKRPAKGQSGLGDIDPGPAIPGLPESEKLALSEHAHYQRMGALHDHNHPFNCAPFILQSLPDHELRTERMERLSQMPRKRFAILRSAKQEVLANPHVVLIHWGVPAAIPQVEDKVKAILGLQFVKDALSEYGVSAPQFVSDSKYRGPFLYPEGKSPIKDARLSPATVGDSDIAKGLRDLLAGRKIPAPGSDLPDPLYLIVAPPEVQSVAMGVTGSHNYFYLDPAGKQRPVHYAWALCGQRGPDALEAIDQLTVTISHELLDACTDPRPPLGYVFQGPEICDIVQGLHGNENGIEVSGYFSHRDGAFRKPEKPAAPTLAAAGHRLAG